MWLWSALRRPQSDQERWDFNIRWGRAKRSTPVTPPHPVIARPPLRWEMVSAHRSLLVTASPVSLFGRLLMEVWRGNQKGKVDADTVIHREL